MAKIYHRAEKEIAMWRWLTLILCTVATMVSAAEKPKAKVIPLEAGAQPYLPILQGAPESVYMRSGLEVLAPGKAVGQHSTGTNEELLVVLEGKGEMRFGNGSSLPVEANHAIYCPPDTTHDVMNTGNVVLRYVYVVSKAN